MVVRILAAHPGLNRRMIPPIGPRLMVTESRRPLSRDKALASGDEEIAVDAGVERGEVEVMQQPINCIYLRKLFYITRVSVL